MHSNFKGYFFMEGIRLLTFGKVVDVFSANCLICSIKCVKFSEVDFMGIAKQFQKVLRQQLTGVGER